MNLLNKTNRQQVLFNNNYSYYANFFDDPSTYLKVGEEMYDLADPQVYGQAAKGVYNTGKQLYNQGKDLYGQAAQLTDRAMDIGKQTLKSLPNIQDNLGIKDAYLDVMSKVNPKAYPMETPEAIAVPKNLQMNLPDVAFGRLLRDKLLGIEAGDMVDAAATGAEIADKAQAIGQELQEDTGGRGLGLGSIGAGSAATGAAISDRINRIKQKKEQANMSAYSYMADFASQPIMNITAKRKVTKAFNKKMGRLAASGDMVSSDPNIRNSALAKAAKVKERMRTI